MSHYDQVKVANQSKLLRILCGKPATRSELARLTGLSPATVSNLTKDLIEQGLVDETKRLESVGGRPPVLLEFNSNAGKVMGIRVSRSRLRAGLVNLGGEDLAWREQPLVGSSPQAVLEGITKLVLEMCAAAGLNLEELVGVGVAIPGIVQEEEGLVRFSTFLDWQEVPLGVQLQKKLGVPVFLQRNGNASAFAECQYGNGSQSQDLLYVHLGDGIGAGIVLDGQIYSGRTGRAGEIGHNIVDPHGPVCRCGKRGCLEALASGRALAMQGEELARLGGSPLLQSLDTITPGDVIAAAQGGETPAQRLLDTAGQYIGTAVAGIVNLLDVAEVVLGGDLLEAGEFLLKPFTSSFHAALLPLRVPEVKIRVSQLGSQAGVLGAAAVVIHQFLSKGGRLER